MACVVHVLLPIRQKVRDAEVLSPPVCASLCLWNRGRRPVEILVWQTAAFCLANRRLLPDILRPRVPSRLVLGLTYSQLFTFHRVLWRCAATSGARGRHASVLMLCVSGKNIYNPQNEMFRCFRTKCSISQNEMYLRESFSLSHQPNKKAPKKLTSPVLFYCLLIWLSRKKITNFT